MTADFLNGTSARLRSRLPVGRRLLRCAGPVPPRPHRLPGPSTRRPSSRTASTPCIFNAVDVGGRQATTTGPNLQDRQPRTERPARRHRRRRLRAGGGRTGSTSAGRIPRRTSHRSPPRTGRPVRPGGPAAVRRARPRASQRQVASPCPRPASGTCASGSRTRPVMRRRPTRAHRFVCAGIRTHRCSASGPRTPTSRRWRWWTRATRPGWPAGRSRSGGRAAAPGRRWQTDPRRQHPQGRDSRRAPTGRRLPAAGTRDRRRRQRRGDRRRRAIAADPLRDPHPGGGRGARQGRREALRQTRAQAVPDEARRPAGDQGPLRPACGDHREPVHPRRPAAAATAGRGRLHAHRRAREAAVRHHAPATPAPFATGSSPHGAASSASATPATGGSCHRSSASGLRSRRRSRSARGTGCSTTARPRRSAAGSAAARSRRPGSSSRSRPTSAVHGGRSRRRGRTAAGAGASPTPSAERPERCATGSARGCRPRAATRSPPERRKLQGSRSVDSEAPDRPVFYYDIGSAYSWLAAERVNQVLPEVPIWRPMMVNEIRKVHGGESWARTDRRAGEQAEVERRARERGLMEVRWPDPWPTPTETVNLAATYAAAGRPRGGVLARRVPPDVQRRARPERARQRADRRRRVRAAPAGGEDRHRDALDPASAWSATRRRPATAACAVFRPSPSATTCSGATTRSRTPPRCWSRAPASVP